MRIESGGGCVEHAWNRFADSIFRSLVAGSRLRGRRRIWS
ncbi:hypothetical protein MMASJCM_1294 [Mycobacteroides abscessus subsp. massiliense CCUG 48898 = JCM 15300]|nr:hypothetical protein MMASJCM_1294 [Mycobacteroides abscessus subsp. massiliense CCUG 48898 = JCM 15300]